MAYVRSTVPRWAIVGLVVVGLGTGIWLLWPDGDQAGATSTPVLAAGTTTSTTAESVVTTTVPALTTSADSHVVETVEEAEEILRELWFGWFEGIYNQDEDRIREVVATEEKVTEAKESFGIRFVRAPSPTDIHFESTEMLHSDEDCVAVWTTLRVGGFRHGTNSAVHVLRWHDEGWVRLATWQYKDDLWQSDCESLL